MFLQRIKKLEKLETFGEKPFDSLIIGESGNDLIEILALLAFYDINPQAPIHVLVIPKKKYCSFTDFMKENDDESILQVMKAIQKIAEELDLKSGYRIICNVGNDGGQEVPHVHFHLLSGKNLGKIIS